MFLIVGLCFLSLLSITLIMLWAHERVKNKHIIPRAKVEECWTSEERRRHPRFDQDMEVEYGIEKKPRLKNGKTINVSRGGMRLMLDEKLQAGAIMEMKVYLPKEKKAIAVEAEVVWTKEAEDNDPAGKRFFHSGIKFIALKEPSNIHFFEYIDSLENG